MTCEHCLHSRHFAPKGEVMYCREYDTAEPLRDQQGRPLQAPPCFTPVIGGKKKIIAMITLGDLLKAVKGKQCLRK